MLKLKGIVKYCVHFAICRYFLFANRGSSRNVVACQGDVVAHCHWGDVGAHCHWVDVVARQGDVVAHR